MKFKYVGNVESTSVSDTYLKTFFLGGEYVITGKLSAAKADENAIISVIVDGDGKTGKYEKKLDVCLFQKTQISNCRTPNTQAPQGQDFMKKLYAFINIKQLLKKDDKYIGDDGKTAKEKATELALDNNFVTDLTSLVVVQPDQKEAVNSGEESNDMGPEPEAEPEYMNYYDDMDYMDESYSFIDTMDMDESYRTGIFYSSGSTANFSVMFAFGAIICIAM